MRRVTGIGGVFFKAKDPERLYDWYERHLGIKRAEGGWGVAFKWKDDHEGDGQTAWAIFKAESKYFDPSPAPFMLNFRVDNLDALLAVLKEEGVEIDPHRDSAEYGKFAWVYDPEGNKIELWEPGSGD
jgi:catechol 2,3-dioxygenase-like lactoylglutathione lyase family enzyme